MNLWLAYNVALGVGLAVALAWAFDCKRTLNNIVRLARMHDEDRVWTPFDGTPEPFDLPTEEIQLPPTMKIGPKLQAFDPWPPEQR